MKFVLGSKPSCAKTANGTERDGAIVEGLDVLAKLDAAGQLDDKHKGWTETFLTLRDGAE